MVGIFTWVTLKEANPIILVECTSQTEVSISVTSAMVRLKAKVHMCFQTAPTIRDNSGTMLLKLLMENISPITILTKEASRTINLQERAHKKDKTSSLKDFSRMDQENKVLWNGKMNQESTGMKAILMKITNSMEKESYKSHKEDTRVLL